MSVNINRVVFTVLFFTALFSCGKGGGTGNNSEKKVEINYSASNSMMPNPERGFIRTFNVYSEGAALSSTILKGLRAQNITLILRLYYLENFLDKPLSSEELHLIQTDFNAIRDAGLKCVLRFAYSDNIGKPDAPLSIVEQHIDQLKPLFESNKDIIAFVQAGFIGAWGEWHASTNGLATTGNQKIILEKLLSVLPLEIMVQVRTPLYKQLIFNTTDPVNNSIAYTPDNKARVGHHNDCFLSGGDEYGTYTNITAEKQYISKEALYVPVGGETCPPQESYNPNCAEGRTQMQLLKWTYLNLDWYQPTIDAWRSSGCFEEFHKNLGYRLTLLSGKFPPSIASGQSLNIALDISNKGYAPLYIKKDLLLVLKNNATGVYSDFPINVDLRSCAPNSTLTINENISPGNIAPGSYSLYIKVADKDPALAEKYEYSIQFANTALWSTEHGGINDLKHTITVK